MIQLYYNATCPIAVWNNLFNNIPYMSQLMRLWHLSPYINSVFKHACEASHWPYTSDFWSYPSSTSILYVCEQQRLWRDCADAQSRLSLRCSPKYAISTKILWARSYIITINKSMSNCKRSDIHNLENVNLSLWGSNDKTNGDTLSNTLSVKNLSCTTLLFVILFQTLRTF